MKFDTAKLNDVGQIRKNNEDACYAEESTFTFNDFVVDYGLYIVADGMGGHQAGEIASNRSIEIISQSILDKIKSLSSIVNFSQFVVESIEKANIEIYNLSRTDPNYTGMGTTITLGLRIDKQLYIGHIGDSRAYLIRENNIFQLTNDHSLVASLVQAGMITKEEAKVHPERNKIFRSLGISPNVKIDTYSIVGNQDYVDLQDSDSLVFCTDGLTNHVYDNEIREIVKIAGDANQACKQLIYLANQRGGDDNITVIVVKSKKINEVTTKRMK